MPTIKDSVKKIGSDLGAAACEAGRRIRSGAADVSAAASTAKEPLNNLGENLGHAKKQTDLSIAYFKDDMKKVAGIMVGAVAETASDIADTAQNAGMLVAGSAKDIKETFEQSSTAASLREKADTLRTKTADLVGKADEAVEVGATKLSRGLAGLRSKLSPSQG